MDVMEYDYSDAEPTTYGYLNDDKTPAETLADNPDATWSGIELYRAVADAMAAIGADASNINIEFNTRNYALEGFEITAANVDGNIVISADKGNEHASATLNENNEFVFTESTTNVQQYISEADDDIAAFYARHKIAMGVRGDGNLSRNLFEHGEKAFHYSNTVKSYKDCLSLLENNLPYAGVSHESKHAMASVLYSAYVNKLPLLLMGPSSKEIADTLSLSVTGKYANQLQCGGPCDIGIIRESYKSTGVLVVTNAFGSDWMISLLQELNQAKCLIVFVHPFIEDISIEASSLYSYCCPISTVDTVDNLADMNGVTGACLSDSFEAYVPTVKGSKRADELMAMSASKLFVRNLAYIEGNAASISGNEADIESFVTENIIEPYKALTQN